MEYGRKTKGKKIYNISLTLFFLIFIFGVLILNGLTKDKVFSEQENRNLKSKPQFSIHNVLENRFTSKYEKYVSDQFLLRNFFINVKASCERFIGKKENNDVYFAQDKYLIGKFKEDDEEGFKEKLKAVNTFSSNNPNLKKYIMIVPNKVKVLSDKLPLYAPEKDELKYINKFYSGLKKDIKTIDVFNILNKNKEKYIYYKSDHHWTTKGAYYAYLQFCSSAGITPKEDEKYNVLEVSKKFYGTLFSKVGGKNVDSDEINVYLPKDKEDILINYIEEQKKSVSLYDSKSLNNKDKYSVFLGGNHPVLKIDTTSDSDKNLLIIKDSYANCFIPFLTSHYKSIIVVDLRYYADDINTLIKDYNITDSLILYNANTFFQDESILNIYNE